MGPVVQRILAQAWSQFTGQCLIVLPNLIASLLFLVLGLAVTWLAGRAARVLFRRSSVERRASRLGLTSWLERAGVYSVTALLARGVQMILGLVTAGLVLYALDAALASELTRTFFLYLPNLVVGVGIFALGLVAGRFTERRVLIGAVNRGYRPARLIASVVRGAIVVLATAIGLDHVGIGGRIVPAVLLILVGGASLAAALAIGLGSRDTVRRWIGEQVAEPQDLADDGIEHW